MEHLYIKNRLTRSLYMILSLFGLSIIILKMLTDTGSLFDYVFFPIMVIGFLFISFTNKIEIWIDEKNIIYKWISIKKQNIPLGQIQEIYLRKHKIIIRTPEDNIKLDIFNAGRKNKELIRNFFRQNIKVPVIDQT